MLAATALASLSSCIADEPFGAEEVDPNATIKVGANVTATGVTRTYIDKGEISDSTYFLIYNKKGSSSSYAHALVDFGDIEGPTTGYVYYMNEDDTRKELKWLDVYGSGTSDGTFYLSNVNPERYTTASTSSLLYWKLKNPIEAAPLDKKWGMNDIILGRRVARASGGRIDFNLDHILSLLKINVEVYGASDSFFVDLDQAEVTISNLCKTVNAVYISSPGSYSYSTSLPTTATSGYYSNPGVLTLVSPADDTPNWEVNPSKEAPENTGTGTYGKKTYSTYQFVLPPQSIPPSPTPSVSSDGYTGTRPRLSITIPRSAVMGGTTDGDLTYSGYIPEVMFELDEDGAMLPTPFNIALRSGYQLNIRATINSPETELTFAPVTIEPWQSKGPFTLTTKQAGIYNETQFRNMLQAYNDGEYSELLRYGYEDTDGNFVFQLWNSISLEDHEIRNMMTSEAGKALLKDFCFLFNGYAFTIGKKGEIKDTDPVLAGGEGQAELYNIVSGNQTEFNGVKTTEHLQKVFRHLTSDPNPNVKELSRYVVINNSDNTIEVFLENVIDIPIDDVFQKLSATTWGYTVNFINKEGEFSEDDGAHINALFSAEDDVRLPLVVRNGYDILKKIVFFDTSMYRMTINSSEELYLFADVVNIYYKYYHDLITLFATFKEGTGSTSYNKWNFDIGSGAQVFIGSKIFLKFVNDDNPDRPDTYLNGMSMVNNGTLDVVLDDYTPFTMSYRGNTDQQARLLRPALDGTGTAQHLSLIVNAYKSTSDNKYQTLWSYGKFENGKWLFDMYTVAGNTWTPTATYEEAFGSMIVDYAAGNYDYEFSCGARGVTVTGVPVPGSTGTTTISFSMNGNNTQYPNDMKALKAMCNGTYWEYRDEILAKQGKKEVKKK